MSLRPKTQKLKHSLKQVPGKIRSMFGPAKSRYYSDIVRIDTRENARKSVATLKQDYEHASKGERRTILQVILLAANRCQESRKRKNITPRENRELGGVADIYHTAYRSLTETPMDKEMREREEQLRVEGKLWESQQRARNGGD